MTNNRFIHHAIIAATTIHEATSCQTKRIVHHAPRCWASLVNYSDALSAAPSPQSMAPQLLPARHQLDHRANSSPRTRLELVNNSARSVAAQSRSSQCSCRLNLSAQPLMFSWGRRSMTFPQTTAGQHLAANSALRRFAQKPEKFSALQKTENVSAGSGDCRRGSGASSNKNA